MFGERHNLPAYLPPLIGREHDLQTLRPLLLGCPGVRILATSREPLQIAGEVTWRVPPLAVPDPGRLPPLAELARVPAVELFVARAGAARPDFALAEFNAATVARVCAHLG